ncbi:hypothetical protein C8A03DRAFT_14573 [Achaetomium macrosporum]|uniref:Uncharacterized protein n=1 Tax=Achaetomium macrosporum TaxID=79813 RepID=A0AAN7CBJ9_9PEZI|nr:hypothetical protein C8A03DRAFT_14573 [Achaetomium macrosporum]
MSEYVEIPPSTRKRFFEPVILLDALRSVYLRDNRTSEPDLESDAGKSPMQTYYCFLNKLSQICDSEPKQPLGKTVSAVVVLDSGTIEYRLASNQRGRRELDTVREYLTDIIDVFGRASDEEMNNKSFTARLLSDVLRKVLAFNRPRIEDYIDSLCGVKGNSEKDSLTFCIESSADDEANEETSAANALRSLLPHIQAARNAPRKGNDAFASHAEKLLKAIHSHYASGLGEYMKKKTRGDNRVADSPWDDVRHALGRLLSYYIAIKVLISARNLWPRIFVDFEVTCIPSRQPLGEPPDIRRNANGILNRMGRNRSTIDACKRHARDLQALGLDDRIRERASPGRFRPIVHAEVNLLDSVLRDQEAAEAEGEDPIRFFNEAEFGRYIGSSKPTCLLCHFYFEAHPSRVRCRETHYNLYPNWRAPDVKTSDGEEAERQRLDIMESLIKVVRNETGRAIRERSYPRRKHDSWDTPTNPLPGSTVRGVDDLASRMSQIGLDDAASTRGCPPDVSSTWGESDSSREQTPGSPTLDADDGVDDEDDDGGVKL